MVNKRLQVWLPLLFSIIMVIGMVVGYKLRENSSVSGFFTLGNRTPMQEILDLIRLRYVDNVEVDSLGNNAINDLLHKLDPHSSYIPASDISFLNDDLRGNFSGIGVEFQMFHDTVNVLNVLPDGPSDKAGLQVGDKFIAIDDSINIAGKNLQPDKIRRYLRGKKGTPVKITVLRDNRLLTKSVNRDIIPVPSVDAAYMINSETGFIHISRFTETTYPEFMRAMEKLQAANMKKLILDLRGNGGGFLTQAANIADEFLDDNKLIVYTQGANVPRYEYRCKRDGLFETGDLVVLCDEGSASASEVLAGALQDWDRATIIGRRTFGKGLVQEQFGLNDGSALRLTVARYYTPLGRNIQKPYSEGYEKYEEEVNKRFHDGEVIKGDTTKKSGPSYKTPKGRIVYGGGGITPDIYIPFDTTSMGREMLKLYMKGTLNNFVYVYYMQNRPQFTQFKNSSQLVAGFKAGEAEWSALKDFAAKDSVFLDKATARDKATIIRRIPALLARQMWRHQGYYEVISQTDEFIQKAQEVLRVKTTEE